MMMTYSILLKFCFTVVTQSFKHLFHGVELRYEWARIKWACLK